MHVSRHCIGGAVYAGRGVHYLVVFLLVFCVFLDFYRGGLFLPKGCGEPGLLQPPSQFVSGLCC